jgi:hypothetical protein
VPPRQRRSNNELPPDSCQSPRASAIASHCAQGAFASTGPGEINSSDWDSTVGATPNEWVGSTSAPEKTRSSNVSYGS